MTCKKCYNCLRSPLRLVRKFKELDKQKFCAEVYAQLANSEPTENPDELTRLLNLAMKNELDNQVPLKKVTIKGIIGKPWYNDEIHEQRKIRRQLERKMKKTHLEVHKEMFLTQRKK